LPEPASKPLEDILSLQLWSLRDLGPVAAQLDAAAAAGLKLVEPYGGQLADPATLAAELAAHGLKAPTSHVGMGDLRGDLSRVAGLCGEVGITRLFMPAFGPDERGTRAADWRARGAELGGMAETLQGSGIALGYHNHFWEFDTCEDGRTALENLFDGAAGSPLAWQADVAWIARGGADPVAWMNRYAGILTSIHVKDQAAPGTHESEDGWCDLGRGTLDWPALWAAAVALGADPLVLEHDKPADPAAFARNSVAYIAGMAR
jgi:sugar phosphate isomerase/epimerase